MNTASVEWTALRRCTCKQCAQNYVINTIYTQFGDIKISTTVMGHTLYQTTRLQGYKTTSAVVVSVCLQYLQFDVAGVVIESGHKVVQ